MLVQQQNEPDFILIPAVLWQLSNFLHFSFSF